MGRAGGPVDPMLSAFARKRPDVRVVEVCRPDPATLPAVDAAGLDVVEGHVREVVDTLLRATALDCTDRTDAWHVLDGDVRCFRSHVRVDLADGDAAMAALLRVRDALAAARWDPAPRDTATPALEATSAGGVRIEARLGGAALHLDVRTPDLRLEGAR